MEHAWTIAFDAAPTPLVKKTASLVERYARGHWARVPAVHWGQPAPDAAAVFRLDASIGAQAFRIARPGGAGPWEVAGGDERGLLYGAGKFLRGCAMEPGGACPAFAGAAGVFQPRMPVRGMYFATHFHNFYHDAPLDRVERYVEDLALWGCNTLSVWFDMHHYTGIDDPAARAMIERLRAILRAANGVGMGAALTSLANEAYSTSPAELRAEPFPHHYRVEVCPSRPGGLDLILKWREEMIRAFDGIEIEYFWIWPYDQGGCKCPECAPWGAKGFVRNAEAVGRLVHRMLPRAKTVISTWEFGYWYEGAQEWDGFYRAVEGRPDWADTIMAEHHGDYPKYVIEHGSPGGLPLLNFPEISMYGMGPWGGFGANLQPARLQKVWNSCRHLLSGGFPYSEGIFEDLNKVICLQLYWAPERPVEDIVREYAAAEFGPGTADDVTRAVYALEAAMGHGTDYELAGKWARNLLQETDPQIYKLPAMPHPEQAREALDCAARRMAPGPLTEWRWRMLWLRAALDAELSRSGGRPTGTADALFEEVARISCAERAEWAVLTPSRRLMAGE